jgi:hypothetical protein
MPNPTGSTYLQSDSAYLWTDGDIYQIAQSDTVEGAGVGASFGGDGVANQPHHVLLNKIDWLHRHLQTDENNLSIIVAALAAFTSSATPTGWLKATSTDVGPIGGQIQLILQWGLIDLSPYANSSSQIVNISFNFPIAFPHATWALHAFWRYIRASPATTGFTTPSVVSPMLPQGNSVYFDLGPGKQFQNLIAGPNNNNSGFSGIGWLAWGY